MSLRTLPPPPPPPHIRAWRNREALLDDRARALEQLAHWWLAPHRALLAWLLAAVLAVGWPVAVAGLAGIITGEGMDRVFGGIYFVMGLLLMVPSGIGLGFAVHRDLRVSARLNAWAELDRHPPTAAHWSFRGRTLFWLLPSVLLCAGSVALAGWTVYALVTSAPADLDRFGFPTVMGLLVVAGAVGAAGATKAAYHRRLIRRELGAGPVRAATGIAHG